MFKARLQEVSLVFGLDALKLVKRGMAILLDRLVDRWHLKFDIEQFKSSRLRFKFWQREAGSAKSIHMEPQAAISFAAYHFLLHPGITGQSRLLFFLILLDVLYLLLLLIFAQSIALLLLLYSGVYQSLRVLFLLFQRAE